MPRILRAAAVVLLVVATAACSDDDDGGSAPTADVELTATIDDHPVSAISAVLDITTDPPTPVAVTVDGPGGGFAIPATDAPRIPVVGMRAESDYTITVTAGETTETLEWTTGALPDDLPPISATVADPARMQPGYTVFNAWSWDPVPEGEAPSDAGYVIAVDGEGEVVWYQRLVHQVLDIDSTPRGTFLVTAGDVMIQEVDLLGTITREWGGRIAIGGEDLAGRPFAHDDTLPLEIDSMHHEITELPNGNFVTLSTEMIELDAADASRLCPEDPEPTIVGDVVVELAPDGAVVQEWPISATFDPVEDPGAEMCIQGPPVAPPNWFYPESGLTRDWTHANAVEVHEDTNTLIVSLRHFDAILALRYHDDDEGKAGELLWSLGTNGTLALDGEGPFHQHAMSLQDDGRLLMYDNGNLRPGTVLADGTAPPYSRAVIYQLDLEAGTATQVWDHRDTWADGRTIFTPFLGDADLVANGNVLITHGGGSTAEGNFQAKIVEVVPGDAPDGSADEVVFDLLIGDGTPVGWSSYRAMRLESLYFASE